MAIPVSERVRKRRAVLRQAGLRPVQIQAGLRPVQIWVPDTRSPTFAREARRQSMLLHDDPHEQEMLDWIEAASDTRGWE